MKIGIQTWGSDGDIFPLIALAGGLSSAGHDVTLVITCVDGKDYYHYGERLNFRLKQTGKLFYDKAEYARLANEIGYKKNPVKQLDLILKKFFEPFADEMYSAARKLCEENDAIIGHFIHYPAQVAAQKAGLRRITVTLNHSGIPTGYTPPAGMPNLGRLVNPLLWKLVMKVLGWQLAPAINRFRVREGCPPIRSVREVWESRLLNLIAVGRIFCEGYPDWEDYQRVCGFLNMPDGAYDYAIPRDLEEFIASGPPPVYMTFGSMVTEMHGAGYIQATNKLMADAARLAGARAIIQSQWDAADGVEESPDIYKVKKAPHNAIFPRCSAVVHHGGAGTTHSSTRAGCPSVVVALVADQPFWGSELRRLGIAPKPLKRLSVTAEKIAEQIRHVLETPEMKVRAEKLGDALRQENGVGRAVEFIEKCIEDK